MVELLAIAWVQWCYTDTPPVAATAKVMPGGALVLAIGILIGNAQAVPPPCPQAALPAMTGIAQPIGTKATLVPGEAASSLRRAGCLPARWSAGGAMLRAEAGLEARALRTTDGGGRAVGQRAGCSWMMGRLAW